MTPEQILAIKCAYADLAGSKQAYEQGDSSNHSWGDHEQTITDLEAAFPNLNLGA
jgi:hypothetical protein